MATGKKKPTSSRSTTKTPITPRPNAARSAAKPPVINLKATEVKSTSTNKPADKSAAQKKPASTQKPTNNKADTKATSTKPTENSKESFKENTKKSSKETAAAKTQKKQPAKKKKGKTGLIVVSLAALIAAGFGGAWAFKEYGQKFFTSPNAANTAQIAAIGDKLTVTNKTIESLQASIKALSQQVSSTQSAQAKTAKDLGSLKSELTQIDTALKAAAKKGAGPADAANTLALEKLTTKLTGVDSAIVSLTKTVGETSAASKQTEKTIAQIKTQLNSVAQGLSKTQAATKSSSDQLAATAKALSAIKAAQAKLENAPTSSQSGQLASAFTILRAKISNGQPFAAELDQIASKLPQELSLDKLRPFAQTGAPTNEALLTALSNLSLETKAPESDPAPKTTGGVWNTLTGKFSGLVKVSKVGETDWQAVQAQAVSYLKSGDLKAAINAINMVKQQPPKPLSNWQSQANKKITIDAAVAQLSASVMARLTASK